MNKQLRKTVIAGNWKMNMTASDVKPFADALFPLVPGFKEWCNVVICASFVLIPKAIEALSGNGAGVGAQNMSQFASGAYTGETSISQLSDIGAGYVIIGHSERREYYGETDVSVNAKLLTALTTDVLPIVCVGETLEQRETGVTFDLISLQVKTALQGVTEDKLKNVIIAYEPVWAIGTGKTATPEDAQEVCKAVRGVIASLYSKKAADGVSILYGGSMNDKNALDLLAQPDIDGGLIGGASLKAESFAVIINAAKQ